MKITKFDESELRYCVSDIVNYNGLDIKVAQYFKEEHKDAMVSEFFKFLQSDSLVKSLEDWCNRCKADE